MATTITRHTEQFATAPQVGALDFAEIAALGYKTVVNNRPDHEEPNQPLAADLAKAAAQAGLDYHYLPVVPGQFTQDQVTAFAEILAAAKQPVLAFCRSGARSTNLWHMAQG